MSTNFLSSGAISRLPFGSKGINKSLSTLYTIPYIMTPIREASSIRIKYEKVLSLI
jgi:hypothetical protein